MDSTVLLAIGFIIVFLVGIMVGALVFSYRTDKRSQLAEFSRWRWWADWAKGISTEMGGAIITTILLGVVLSLVQEYRAQEQHKAELILQMGSPDNGFAVEAARQLSALGWLRDGSLRREFFQGANLQGADLAFVNLPEVNLALSNLQEVSLMQSSLQRAWLVGANLREAELNGVNLQWANLKDVNLQQADLLMVNLEGANLAGANLQGVILSYTSMQGVTLNMANLQGVILKDKNLREATFWEANLQGTDLQGTDLTGANLEGANLQEATLPDGTKWTPETDMARFTDPQHPDFWRSNDPNSPAYQAPDQAN